MKKLIALLLVSVMLLSGCGYTQDDLAAEREAGYTQGKRDGYSLGYDDGFTAGKNEFFAFHQGLLENQKSIEELEAENKTLSAEVSNLEHQVDTQTVEIASLKAALEEAQSKPASSGSGSSTGSSSGGTTSSTSDTQSVTVYITNTGSKYHKNGCQYLRESKNAVTLTQAKSWGYTPCSRCY